MAYDPAEPDRPTPDMRAGLRDVETTSPEVTTTYRDPPSVVPSIIASLAGTTMPGGTYGPAPEPAPVQPSDMPTEPGTPPGLMSDLQEVETRRIGSERFFIDQMDRRDAELETRMRSSFDAQMAEGRHLQPWNAQLEMASRKHDLWEQFGSPGFLIAMMASAFTAMPMVSALNGGAAAMNAINAGDMDGYDKAFDAWKTNTDLVLKRMDIQQRAFQDLNQLRQTNLSEWRERMTHTLAMYDDQRKLTMLNYGFDEDVIKAQEGEIKLRTDLAASRQALIESNVQTMALQASPDWPYDFNGKLKPGAKVDAQKMLRVIQDVKASLSPGPKSAEQLALSTLTSTPGFWDQDPSVMRQQINEVVSGVAGARYGAKGPLANTEVRRQWDAWDAANPDATDEEKNTAHNKIYADFLSQQSLAKLSTAEREMRNQTDAWDAAHPTATDEEKNAAHLKIISDVADAKAHPKMTDAFAKQLSNPQWLASPEGQAWIAKQPPEAQKDYQEFITNYSKGLVKVDPAKIGWTPEAVNAAAETYNETGVLPHYLGARNYGPMVMGAIQARAAELLKEKYPDKSEVDRIAARTQQWQLYRSQQVAINRFESGPQGNTLRSLNVVVQHLQTLAELESSLEGGDLPRFRQISQWWAQEFGEEAPTDFDTAARIVGNEVMKAIQSGNIGTGGEREEAVQAFSRVKNPDQLYGAIGVAQRLLIGQIRGIKHQFLVSTHLPESEFNKILLPETLSYFGKSEIESMTPVSDEPPSERVRRQLQPGTPPVIQLDPLH